MDTTFWVVGQGLSRQFRIVRRSDVLVQCVGIDIFDIMDYHPIPGYFALLMRGKTFSCSSSEAIHSGATIILSLNIECYQKTGNEVTEHR